MRAKLEKTMTLQEEIWTSALRASHGPGAAPDAAKLFLPALNEMFGMTTTRAMASENHPPMALYFLLAGLSLIGSLLVGYSTSGNKGRIWLHMTIFALLLTLVIFVIVNLEFPRLGLIRVDPADHFLVEIRHRMR